MQVALGQLLEPRLTGGLKLGPPLAGSRAWAAPQPRVWAAAGTPAAAAAPSATAPPPPAAWARGRQPGRQPRLLLLLLPLLPLLLRLHRLLDRLQALLQDSRYQGSPAVWCFFQGSAAEACRSLRADHNEGMFIN